MKNIYEDHRSYENDRILLRPVSIDDAAGLLAVYSDEKSRKLFNCDNFEYICSFDTLEQMQSEIEFYLKSYERKEFVRWTVVSKENQEIAGTIENFYRKSEDAFGDSAILRIDLRSDYEREDFIMQLLELVLQTAYRDFECNRIATKAIDIAKERISALLKCGFTKSDRLITGHKGEEFGDYYVREEI